MNPKVIGVLGLGSIGLRHAKNIMSLDCQVLGFDPDYERQNFLREMQGNLVKEEIELFKSVDIIIICSPNQFHMQHLKQAVEHNCHVLIEKPLADRTTGLQEILLLAKEKGLLIAPAMNMRFDGVVKRTKVLLDEKDMGKPLWARFVCSAYLPSWRKGQDHLKGYTNQKRSGGVIFDIIHEFDIAYTMLGNLDVQSCHAHNSGSIGLSVEDCADVNLLSRRDGTAVSIHLDYVSKYPQRYFEIQFENGYIRADIIKRMICMSAQDSELQEEKIMQPEDLCYLDEMKCFFDAINREDMTFLCTPEAALEVLNIVISARESGGLQI